MSDDAFQVRSTRVGETAVATTFVGFVGASVSPGGGGGGGGAVEMGLRAMDWPMLAAALSAVADIVPVAPAERTKRSALSIATLVLPLVAISNCSIMLPGGVNVAFVPMPKTPTSSAAGLVVVTVGAWMVEELVFG